MDVCCLLVLALVLCFVIDVFANYMKGWHCEMTRHIFEELTGVKLSMSPPTTGLVQTLLFIYTWAYKKKTFLRSKHSFPGMFGFRLDLLLCHPFFKTISIQTRQNHLCVVADKSYNTKIWSNNSGHKEPARLRYGAKKTRAKHSSPYPHEWALFHLPVVFT